MSSMPPKKSGSSDIFQTSFDATDLIARYLPKDATIWECAAGEGLIVQRLEHHGHTVIGTDVLSGFDFLSPLMPPPDFDIIVTNPPYSVKDAWLQRCFDLGKPFALLMPITAMGEQKRVKMYKKHGIQVLLPKGRTEFITPSGKVGGSWFYAAWFCSQLLPEKICFE